MEPTSRLDESIHTKKGLVRPEIMGASFLRGASPREYRARDRENRFIGSDPSGLGEDYSVRSRKGEPARDKNQTSYRPQYPSLNRCIVICALFTALLQ